MSQTKLTPRFRKWILCICIISCLLYEYALAVYGIDVSLQQCATMTLSDWQCFYNSGKRFAIIETWNGGYQFNQHIETCVGNAWKAGMLHVDVYAFMCPRCRGNTPVKDAVKTMINELHKRQVKFGMLWFDVEQCTNCWYDVGTNANFVAAAVNQSAALGIHTGVYSSVYEWKETVGNFSGLHTFPLWYAHYDQNPSFSDSWAYQFGGWSKPAIKQYYDHAGCGVDADANWYPDAEFEALHSDHRISFSASHKDKHRANQQQNE